MIVAERRGWNSPCGGDPETIATWLVSGRRCSNAMTCPRCNGLMVREVFVDLLETTVSSFPGWRCVICGAIIDPLIVTHRRARPEPHRSAARSR